MSYKVAYQITELALQKKLQNNYCIWLKPEDSITILFCTFKSSA